MHLGQLDNAYISIQCPTNDESCHQLRASLMMNFNPCYDPVVLNMEMYFLFQKLISLFPPEDFLP